MDDEENPSNLRPPQRASIQTHTQTHTHTHTHKHTHTHNKKDRRKKNRQGTDNQTRHRQPDTDSQDTSRLSPPCLISATGADDTDDTGPSDHIANDDGSSSSGEVAETNTRPQIAFPPAPPTPKQRRSVEDRSLAPAQQQSQHPRQPPPASSSRDHVPPGHASTLRITADFEAMCVGTDRRAGREVERLRVSECVETLANTRTNRHRQTDTDRQAHAHAQTPLTTVSFVCAFLQRPGRRGDAHARDERASATAS